MKALTVSMSLMLLALVTGGSFGDEASLRGVGGAIEVMQEHPSVVMDRMDVHIDFRPFHARVDCDFILRNTGDRTTVKMGFPETSYYQPHHQRPVGFDWFVTWVDGRRVRTKIEGLKWEEPGHHWSRWRVRNVTFASGQVRRVRVAYAAPPAWTGEPVMIFYYHVSTGASWKGPIGKARVRVDAHYDPRHEWFLPSSGRKTHLAFRRVGKTAFEATADNLEPTENDDADLTYVPYYAGLSFGDAELLWLNNPYFEGGTLWVPARELGEELHAGVSWKAGTAVLSLRDKQVRVVVGSRWMDVNETRQQLPAAPRIRHRVLYVSLRPVATALGAGVDFDPEWRTIKVSTAQNAEATRQSADRFPAGTTLVVYDNTHDRTYFATEDFVQEQRTEVRFSLEDQYVAAGAISVSEDGQRLILRDALGSAFFVLDAANLRLVRQLDATWAWWDGSRLGYLQLDDWGRKKLGTATYSSPSEVRTPIPTPPAAVKANPRRDRGRRCACTQFAHGRLHPLTA